MKASSKVQSVRVQGKGRWAKGEGGGETGETHMFSRSGSMNSSLCNSSTLRPLQWCSLHWKSSDCTSSFTWLKFSFQVLLTVPDNFSFLPCGAHRGSLECKDNHHSSALFPATWPAVLCTLRGDSGQVVSEAPLLTPRASRSQVPCQTR